MLDVSGMLYIQLSTQYDVQTLFYYFGHQTEHYTELFEQNYITFHYLSIQQLHHINQYVRPNSPNTLLSVCLKNKYQTWKSNQGHRQRVQALQQGQTG